MITGATNILKNAGSLVNKAIEEYGEEKGVEYPNTAYDLPVFYAFLEDKVKTIGKIRKILEEIKESIKEEPTYENALKAGKCVLFAAEAIEALKYIEGEEHRDAEYTGFIPDDLIRRLGLSLVDGTIPGIAVILGKTRTGKEAKKLIRSLQERGILCCLCGDIIDQLHEEGVNIGLDLRVIPLGKSTETIHALNFALRTALIFGGLKRGMEKEIREYMKERVPVFVISLGEKEDMRYGIEAGVLFCNIPIVTDQEEEEIEGRYISEKDYKKMIHKALELAGIKIKVAKIDIPVPFGSAFEGERVRKNDVFVEIGGGRSIAFELLKMGTEEIEDGKIDLIGKDLNEIPEGSTPDLGVIVEVYGEKMEKDFEPVMERRFHDFVNCASGIMHVAQRDLIWIRISKEAREAGFLLRDIGTILHGKLHQEFSEIVDKVQIKIITDKERVEKEIIEARKIYREREEKTKNLTDESVDTFYSCTLCQSFAPDHVCIITPERTGLCGGVNWMDAKTGYRINKNGPNQPVRKDTVIDIEKGEWKEVNEFVREASHGKIERVCLYSAMENPHTSCGCFECIVAFIPEANGFMIVNREFGGKTPCGMSFSTLAGSVGGGVQVPGFIGVAKRYILSKKFILKEGGLKRIVWMPKSLKEELKPELKKRAEEISEPDLLEKIADETICTDPEELVVFLSEKNHPSLSMEMML